MPKMTVSVPGALLTGLRTAHPEINWAEVVRSGIMKKLEKLEILKKRGDL